MHYRIRSVPLRVLCLPIVVLAVCIALTTERVPAADWPMLGGTETRNPVSAESGAPIDWQVRTFNHNTQQWRLEGERNVKWAAELGSVTYGDAGVADGLVWVGTNNRPLSNDEPREDASVLMCFRERDGKLLYKYVSPRLVRQRVHDWPFSSLACSPLIEGDRMWFTTNRGEVVCLDIGPLLASRDKPNRAPEDDPRVLWKIDMIGELGVFCRGTPMNISHLSSPAGYKDWIYVITGNGVDDAGVRVPNPEAPSLLCIEKETGKVVWSDNSPGENLLSGQWTSPLVMEIDGRAQCIAPQGDGWLRSFDVVTGELLWEFDINPKESKWEIGGEGTRDYFLAPPVYYDGRIYIASGDHPMDAVETLGRLVCIDPTKNGDISSELAVDAHGQPLPHRRIQAVDPARGERSVPNPNSGLVWEFTRQGGDDFLNVMHGSVTSVAAAEGLIVAVDLAGAVHCLDAKTGKRHWVYDLLAECHASPLIVDGKVYVADGDAEVAVFRLSPDPDVAMKRVTKGDHPHDPIAEIQMAAPVYCSPIFANGVLYLATRSHLFAIHDPDAQAEAPPRTAMGEWTQWRGPERANRSPETGLLDAWPEGGPPLVWQVEGLGHGIASVSIAGGHIYTTTYTDQAEYVVALDQATGRLAWATHIGRSVFEIPLMRLLSQRSPTIDGDRLYVLTALGDLICLSTADGSERWRKNYESDFGGRLPSWNFCDFPLVDGDKLICTPHGRDSTMVALDKHTGETIWTCSVTPNEGQNGSTYAATVAVDVGGTRQYVNFLQGYVTGVDAEDGRLLWRYEDLNKVPYDPQHALTPIVKDDRLFCVGARGGELALLRLIPQEETISVREVYRRDSLLNRFQDSLVAAGAQVFATDRRGGVMCLALESGEELWREEQRRFDRRSLFIAMTYADGHLYVRHADGRVVLVEASPEKYLEKGRFQLPDPEQATGATAPVVAGGRLYLRDGNRLFCYDIRRGALDAPQPQASKITLGFPQTDFSYRQRGRGRSRSGLRSVFVPTPQDVVAKMLEVAGVTEDDLVYDLGSGDGRIVITAAKEYGSRAVGIEIDEELVKVSQARVEQEGVGDQVTIKQGDVFDADLSQADVVAVYLLPNQLERLIPQFDKLPAGARIVSHQFEIPSIKPHQTISVRSDEDGAEHAIHMWVAPLKRAP